MSETVEDVLADLSRPTGVLLMEARRNFCARIEAAHAREIAEKDAGRASLAQEIAAALKVRGLWAGNGEPSDLITAVCGALAAKDAEIDALHEAHLQMAREKDAEIERLRKLIAERNERIRFMVNRSLAARKDVT